MNEPLETYLKPTELGAFLGLQPRQAWVVLGTLESLGYALVPAQQGVRLCPPGLAATVKAVRREERDLASLRVDSALRPYLNRDVNIDDPLERLINLGGEVALPRETVGALRCGGPGAPAWTGVRSACPTRTGSCDVASETNDQLLARKELIVR